MKAIRTILARIVVAFFLPSTIGRIDDEGKVHFEYIFFLAEKDDSVFTIKLLYSVERVLFHHYVAPIASESLYLRRRRR